MCLRAISRAALSGRKVTLSRVTTKLSLQAAVLPFATVFVVAVCAAAGPTHPVVAAGAGCVTRLCHAPRLELAAAARGGSTHQPAVEGDCTSCHDLALTAEVRFVKGAPDGRADGPGGSRTWDLDLCLGCHGEALLAATDTAGATGFADGRRNLHALHVQAGRGRRCLTCHDPHAARQPKLLRELIPARGNARIAQEFRGDPGGGQCKTGCHAPKSYRR